MEEIVLPIAKGEGFERINNKSKKINLEMLLTVSQKSIKYYVKRGILPEPLSDKDGIMFFSKDAVAEKFGLKSLEEELVSSIMAAKIVKVSVYSFKKIVNRGMFTVITVNGQSLIKKWFIKREIEEYFMDIEKIMKPWFKKKDIKFFTAFFSDANIKILELILKKPEIDILKKVYIDKKSYEEIGIEYDLPAVTISRIFLRAIRGLEFRFNNVVPQLAESKKKKSKEIIIEIIEGKYNRRFLELEKKISYLQSLIKDAEDVVKVSVNLKEIKVPDDYELYLNDPIRALLQAKISDFDLSNILLYKLKSVGIETLEDLVSYNPSKFMEIPNFGKTSLRQLEWFVKYLGLRLGMDLSIFKQTKS